MKKTVALFFVLAMLAPTLHAKAPDAFGEPTSVWNGYFKKKKKKKKKSKGSSDGAPSFTHGIGASLFAAPSNAPDSIGDNSAGGWAITYFPSFKLADVGSNSIRLAASPSIGFSGSANSRSGGSLSLVFDLPIDAELHFGDQEGEAFGGLVGAGFALNRMASTDFGTNKAFGPHFTAGIQFPVRGQTVGIRGSFLLNLSSKKDDYGLDGKNVISGSIFKMF